jgi:1-acyl-sn-glycerol-3-phosphate acyltransferase
MLRVRKRPRVATADSPPSAMTAYEHFQWIFYRFLRVICRTIGVFFVGYRADGRKNVPGTGGLLVCSNHQSYLDPVLVGMAIDRKVQYVARANLFRNFLFGGLIRILDAIPLERGGAGALRGLLETVKRLRNSKAVLIFPEGTRTETGELGVLQPGFVNLARRAESPILPVAIDGAFQSWPRSGLPWFQRIHVSIGQPISRVEIDAMDDATLIARLTQDLTELNSKARRRRMYEGQC